MGWAERQNLKSRWNQRHLTKMELPSSIQTTTKEHFNQATIPLKADEPVGMTLKSFGERIICRIKSSLAPPAA